MLRLSHLAPLTVLAVILAGCSPTVEPTPTATPSASADEPLFASEAEAVAAADDLIQRYWAATNTVYQAGGTGVEILEPFVTEERMDVEESDAEMFVRGGFMQVGEYAVDSTTFQQIVEERDGRTKLIVTVCVDYSGARAFNAEGLEAVRKDAPPRFLHQVAMLEVEGELRIDITEPWADSPC